MVTHEGKVWTMCLLVNMFAPAYMSEMFCHKDLQEATYNRKCRLKQPLRMLNSGQGRLSYLGPKLCNDLSPELKSTIYANTAKHKIKRKTKIFIFITKIKHIKCWNKFQHDTPLMGDIMERRTYCHYFCLMSHQLVGFILIS